MAHAWAEFCLRNGETDCTGYVGAECPDAALASFPPLRKEMADAVNVYLDAIYAELGTDDELYVEQRVDLGFVSPGMFGTNDCSILKPDGILRVFDYKHGAGVYVDERDNPQTKYYALGALHAFRDRGVKKVSCTIVQPRAAGEPVRTAEYHALDIWEFAGDLREAAARTRDPNAPLVAGDHCRFCPAAGTCEAFRAAARRVACDDMNVITDPETLPADELAERLAEVDLLRAWCKAIEERADREARAGNVPRGWKWVSSLGNRAWSLSESEAIAAVKERTGVDISHVGCLSPAQAEKEIGKPKFGKSCADLISRPTRPALVRESDKRPAIALTELNAADAADGMTIV